MGKLRKINSDLKKRDEAARTMCPLLVAKMQQIKKLLIEQEQVTLKRAWNMGKLVKELSDNRIKYDPAEQRPVEKVALVLNYSQHYLYQVARFCRDFSEEHLQNLLAMETARGSKLSWMHIQALLVVDDIPTRNRILAQWMASEWTMEEYKSAIDKALGRTAANRHKGGPKFGIPSSISGKVTALTKQSDLFIRKDEHVFRHKDHSILKSIEAMPADKVTSELIAQIDESRKKIDQLLDEVLPNLREDLAKAKTKAVEKMQAQAKITAARDVNEIDKPRPVKGQRGRRSILV